MPVDQVQAGPKFFGSQSSFWPGARGVLGGVQAVANDVLVHRYKVRIPTGKRIHLTAVSITAKIKPVSGAYSLDIKVSTDRAVTFTTIFTAGIITLPSGEEEINLTPSFIVGFLYSNNQLRVDVLAVDGTVSGGEVLLQGYLEDIPAE